MLIKLGLVMGIVMMETTNKSATLMAGTAVGIILLLIIALNVYALNELQNFVNIYKLYSPNYQFLGGFLH